MGKSFSNNTKVIALLGSQSSGKTSLLESFLYITGTIDKKGLVEKTNTFGDSSPESKKLQMSVELTCANINLEGQNFTFIDCPGSIEFKEERTEVLNICDAAIVVTEPKVEKLPALTPIFKELDKKNIPHFLFINKIETLDYKVKDLIHKIQILSERPLILKEIPLREDNQVIGYVDLVSEQAYKFDKSKPSSLIQIPTDLRELEKESRQVMIETLADYDDRILEKVLDDNTLSTEEINQSFAQDIEKDLLVPVLLGGALDDNGTRKLLRELLIETPDCTVTESRLGFSNRQGTNLTIFKTLHLQHKGKVSLARAWNAPLTNNSKFGNVNIGTLYSVHGESFETIEQALPSQIVGLAKIDQLKTGDKINSNEYVPTDSTKKSPALFAKAISVTKSTDEIKLSSALEKICEEDPSVKIEYNESTQQLLLWGQGEIHLKYTMDKLMRKYGLELNIDEPKTPYKETIEASTKVRGRHKKQSGGHGQFGDVQIEIKPKTRGAGFQFTEVITGGVIPKNYFSAIEEGVKSSLKKGPLGFPVEDLEVTLFDGSFHKVDSSDLAFSSAAIVAMKEGLPACQPLLLEPVNAVQVSVPEESLAAAQKLITRHRGSILGFDSEHDYLGWCKVSCNIPQAEMNHLIIELRSLTHGLGYFEQNFDHMNEIRGKMQEQLLNSFS